MAQVNRPPTKPNLLFIFTDQQRFDTMRCYGNHLIQTPNLNALANDSFVFQNAYVTQPLCTPARSSIMTGLYPHTNGCIHLNIPHKPSTPTIAEMVPSEYECGYIGKWHLGDEIFPQHGFGHWVGMEDHYRLFFTKREYLSRFSDYHHFLLEHGYTPDVEWMAARIFSRELTADLPWEMSKNAYVAREAARFIRENGDRPGLLRRLCLDYVVAVVVVNDPPSAPPRVSSGLAHRFLPLLVDEGVSTPECSAPPALPESAP